MDKEREEFYIVRKGDIIGIYKNIHDCHAQLSASICDPPVSVYKGYALKREVEEYLASRGLRNSLYSISADVMKEDLFVDMLPCPFQQPDESAFFAKEISKKSGSKRTQDMLQSTSAKPDLLRKQHKHGQLFCVLEFDGASKGNPGKSGAGAVLKNEDGSVIAKLREGLGVVTNNVAEYRALILGLRYAKSKGFSYIRVQGDSILVCKQVQDLWKTRNDNMAGLCKTVKELRDSFMSFDINHVKREYNSDADAQANLAVNLPAGEIQEELSTVQSQ